jgi:hypothetical protein
VSHPVDLVHATLVAVFEFPEEGASQFHVLWQHYETTNYPLAAHNNCGRYSATWRTLFSIAVGILEKGYFSSLEHEWHGTRIELIADILAKGLQVKPHEKGCLGGAEYLASEQAKVAVCAKAQNT